MHVLMLDMPAKKRKETKEPKAAKKPKVAAVDDDSGASGRGGVRSGAGQKTKLSKAALEASATQQPSISKMIGDRDAHVNLLRKQPAQFRSDLMRWVCYGSSGEEPAEQKQLLHGNVK